MSVATVVTQGYGTFGSVALVITDGFAAGGAVPAPTHGGSGQARPFAEWRRPRSFIVSDDKPWPVTRPIPPEPPPVLPEEPWVLPPILVVRELVAELASGAFFSSARLGRRRGFRATLFTAGVTFVELRRRRQLPGGRAEATGTAEAELSIGDGLARLVEEEMQRLRREARD